MQSELKNSLKGKKVGSCLKNCAKLILCLMDDWPSWLESRTCGINQRVSRKFGILEGEQKIPHFRGIFLFMYFIYILYSAIHDKYYVGYSNDPHRRLVEHNTTTNITFTSKYRPWRLAAIFSCSETESDAIRIEKFIKRQKSRKLLEKLCETDFVPDGRLAQLVRVPHMRD